MDFKALIAQGDQLFSKRSSFMSFLQDVAENFYPQRADFTVNRVMGDNFAENLTTSYPCLVQRDLGNSLGTMLRPNSLDWFAIGARGTEFDQAGKEWLEDKSKVMRKAMYDRSSQFLRATKEGDHDFSAFGQAVLSVEVNAEATGILYRCWHIRDVAWCEDAQGKISTVHRKWKPTALMLKSIFRDKIHPKVEEKLSGPKREPYCEINVRHIVIPANEYEGEYVGKGRPRIKYVSVFIDIDNQHEMEAVGQTYMKYVIPRWQTVSGSQYAYSPATVIALPDARLLQAMTSTLLEAGEKATTPPLIGVQEAMRSDLAVYAGGITWVDAAYDEREGSVLRPLTQDLRGIPFGIDMQRDARSMLTEAFYLNKLTLPATGPDMTAYEVSQRVQDYIRQAAPVFEPMETEYNGGLCEATFEAMMGAGTSEGSWFFGRFSDIPESLLGKDPGFRFESPLHDAIEKQKGQKFIEAIGLTSQAVALDQTAPANLDVKTAFRDALSSIGIPAKWMTSEDEAAQIVAAEQEKAQAAQLMAAMQQGGEAAKAIGEGQQALVA